MSVLQAIKSQNQARELEDRRLQLRRRNLLVLILRHLCDQGYVQALEKLCTEANLSLAKVDAADNIDLLTIMQEYEDFYEFKFGRRPKLVRSVGAEEVMAPSVKTVLGQRNASESSTRPPGKPVSGAMAARERREKAAAGQLDRKSEAAARRKAAMDSVKLPPEVGAQRVAGVTVSSEGRAAACHDAMSVSGRPLSSTTASTAGVPDGQDGAEQAGLLHGRLLKPLPDLGSSELRELGAAIMRDIIQQSPAVRWQDVAGLQEAKRLLQEAVVLPLKYPQLFTGILAPWKGVLLYGPPGTGKTLLARAVASECQTTFFNISASTIVSKYRGDSEKLVRVLFDLARYHEPSTIFLDECDAVMGARGEGGEHEASRRMKTELLTQMDGLQQSGARIFVLAATNLPWQLDAALLRRLEKRIFVPLPECTARQQMLEVLLGARCQPAISLADLAEGTAGFSGCDVACLAKEAAMRPLRRLMAQLEVVPPSSTAEPSVDQISQTDLQAALEATKPTAHVHKSKYEQFTSQYGQPGA
ncbi:hypothetical protein WJX72_010220 [[Myrmecia] bisecta]|uniref:Katanin p60 ATPase-containing subunit A-like 2 n=1 Tax=[Myrmecia] bisecta TaxID=41462 RepID=A0AAW1R8S4_9CHLO